MKRLFSILAAFLLLSSSLTPLVALAQESSTGNNTPSFKLSDQTISCLKTNLGDSVFASFEGGSKPQLTADQQAKAKSCFTQNAPAPAAGQTTPPPKPDTAQFNFAPATETCLKKILGDNYKQAMSNATRDEGESLREKTKDCFGEKVVKDSQQQPGQPGEPGGDGSEGVPSLPASVKACIIKTVGQSAADEMFGGNLPGSDVADKIESAGCFQHDSIGPPKSPNGETPKMSAEAESCFKDVTGTTPDKRPALNKDQMKQLREKCFKGGGPGGPGGPNGGQPQLPDSVKNCFKDNGLDLTIMTKGPDLLTEAQKQAVGNCFQKNNFMAGPGGPNGGPNGPNGPQGGPNGGPGQMPEEVKKCIEGITGSVTAQNLSDEQRQKIGKECFKGGPGGGPNGPNGPQGGPNGGPGNQPPSGGAFDKCAGQLGFKPGPDLSDAQKQQMQQCIHDNGGGQQGPPNGQQPGQPGQPPNGQSGPGGGPPPNGQPGQPPQGLNDNGQFKPNNPGQNQNPPPNNNFQSGPGGPPPNNSQGPGGPPNPGDNGANKPPQFQPNGQGESGPGGPPR